jgi:protein-disulfide isomerase
MFDSMQPRQSFWIGVAAGIMGLCTIGFFILLSQGSDFSFKKAGTTAKAPIVTDTNNPTPSQPTAGVISMAPISGDDHIRGDVNAPVVIVEYSDTECPFCKQFHGTMQQIVDEYDGAVAWVYRHFPLDQLHAKARNEAHATECAAELGGNDGFWNYTDQVYARTNSNDSLPESELAVIAGDIGLNVSDFNDCMASGKYSQKIEAMYQDAIAAGGRGTPYSVVVAGDTQIPLNGAQPVSQVRTVIDSLLSQ